MFVFFIVRLLKRNHRRGGAAQIDVLHRLPHHNWVVMRAEHYDCDQDVFHFALSNVSVATAVFNHLQRAVCHSKNAAKLFSSDTIGKQSFFYKVSLPDSKLPIFWVPILSPIANVLRSSPPTKICKLVVSAHVVVMKAFRANRFRPHESRQN
jgi:hypothetical protein